jgi:hypothetical protein
MCLTWEPSKNHITGRHTIMWNDTLALCLSSQPLLTHPKRLVLAVDFFEAALRGIANV